MAHHSMLHYEQLAPAEMTSPMSAVTSLVLRHAFPDTQVADPILQPLPAENSAEEQLSRAQRLGEWLARQNNSGRLNLVMWGVSTWPGPFATYSQMVLFGARALGTYNSVRQAGFSGARAVVVAGQWTWHAFTCPVSSEQFPPELVQPSILNTGNFETPAESTRSRNLRVITAHILRRSADVG